MFDLKNPNIFKSLIPIGLGTTAYTKFNDYDGNK